MEEKKLLLKINQSPLFKGEGKDIEQDAKIWIEAMNDYFLAAGTLPANQFMISRFCLQGNAKLWWKQQCRDNCATEGSQSWALIKQTVVVTYLPPDHQVLKMNEFFQLCQINVTLDDYYSKFVALCCYAPLMSQEQQISRFCQGLNAPLDARLEAMRPTSL